MEVQTRKLRTVQLHDQENIYGKTKTHAVFSSKRDGLTVRGVLGELNGNVQVQRDVNKGKITVTVSEIDKKPSRIALRSNYNHVQSKVDSGLATKPVLPTKPTLRREESTASLAAKAAARTKLLLKEAQKTKEAKKNEKNSLQTVKEVKTSKAIKPLLNEPTDSLGKLKLSEASSQGQTKYKGNPVCIVKPLPLPHDIEDIDASDNSPLLMSIYIKDIYQYLTELEEKYPIEKDHFKNQTHITGKMRSTLLEWLAEVQHQFSMLLETFQISVGIVDRYLQIVSDLPRNKLQLVGITALFIASKYEEIYAPNVNDFIYVTDCAYSKEELFQCERDIIVKLGYCLARPIPLSFLRRYVKAARGTSKIHHLAKYLVDLSLVEYTTAHYRPSEVAAAAICLSLHLHSSKTLPEVWTPTLTYYSGYSLQHIKPIIKKLAEIVVDVENNKFKALYKIYSSAELGKVSTLPQLRSESVYRLAEV
ncbi:PREDICTED: G2/mitotic-specific cyclin-B1 [Papilio polytes]|uniref:G2/mitotic-specific cyclin-B1 n=1 Tax=Papilio polytes TaxID=76194 RepID=UPI0006769651|nr:PREDICTED: G2/mitotic-specific cyclin-B1 [Papilio polytes]